MCSLRVLGILTLDNFRLQSSGFCRTRMEPEEPVADTDTAPLIRSVTVTVKKTYDYVLKLMLLGSKAVGKSCLLLRFCEDVFDHSLEATVGAYFQAKPIVIDGKIMKLEIWDTAAAELYRKMIPMYLRSVHGVMLVYDVTDRCTFNNTRDWICDLEKDGPADIEKIVLGNKCDLNNCREVSREAGEELAMDYGIKFLETSALSGVNVEEAFFTLTRDIISRLDRKVDDCNASAEDPVNISESQSKSLCCCCCCPRR